MEARTRGNRDRPSATTEATLPEKTQGFVPRALFTRECSYVFYDNRPWYDDMMMMKMMMVMVMMMMTTWQDCPVTFSRNSEVRDLNFLWKVQRPTDINQQEFWKLLALRSWAVSTSASAAVRSICHTCCNSSSSTLQWFRRCPDASCKRARERAQGRWSPRFSGKFHGSQGH